MLNVIGVGGAAARLKSFQARLKKFSTFRRYASGLSKIPPTSRQIHQQAE
jgi:hypothetical protein